MKAIKVSGSNLVLLKDEKTNELVFVDPNTDQEICLSKDVFLKFAHKIEFESISAVDLGAIDFSSVVSSSPIYTFKTDCAINPTITINSEPYMNCNLLEENNL